MKVDGSSFVSSSGSNNGHIMVVIVVSDVVGDSGRQNSETVGVLLAKVMGQESE